ncbi:hypothetical protein J4H86_11900 [Spiractinospora alimapuensis]|uniref:SGNH/GDSL hydrolase family protein n=1 Tax=Spiractinospora alimapuensis TaxID=2820884 RepID=UPI001F2FD93C|nr:GDSL-type esterase/lipase family protein [Spiractinospora alimapuensis]QVQ54318.1 hypothetical protein J4H86_11900 [Spiractinospora alimapuensis]
MANENPPEPSRRRARWQPGVFGLLAICVGAFAVTLPFTPFGPGGLRFGEAEPESVTVDATPPLGIAELMIVGDSTAQGSAGDYTWRYRLWTHLNEDSEVEARFVGPYDELFSLAGGEDAATAYAEPDFDTEHASVWGTTVERLADEIGGHVAEFEPDYLLVMAGLNDMLTGSDADAVGNRIADLVATARVARGDLQVVVSELPPVWGTTDDSRLNEEIAAFNAALPGLAAELTGEDSPVVVARSAEEYAPADDNWDPVHPNANGEVKIAAAFADTLADELGLGEPYARPLPDLPVGPRIAPEVSVEPDPEDDGSVRLTWDPVPGATNYEVEQRRVEPDPDDQVPVPGPVTGFADNPRGLRVEHLLAGATYSFVVRPLRGEDAGEEAEVRVELDLPAPAAPEDLTFTSGNVSLEWSGDTTATHFAVWRRALDCAEDDPTDCEPVDDDDPADAPDSWEAVTVTDESSWEVDTVGASGYEFLVRSHRDFVEGEFSAPVTSTD